MIWKNPYQNWGLWSPGCQITSHHWAWFFSNFQVQVVGFHRISHFQWHRWSVRKIAKKPIFMSSMVRSLEIFWPTYSNSFHQCRNSPESSRSGWKFGEIPIFWENPTFLVGSIVPWSCKCHFLAVIPTGSGLTMHIFNTLYCVGVLLLLLGDFVHFLSWDSSTLGSSGAMPHNRCILGSRHGLGWGVKTGHLRILWVMYIVVRRWSPPMVGRVFLKMALVEIQC